MTSSFAAIAAFPRRPLKLHFGWRAHVAIWGGLAMVTAVLGWLAYTAATEAPELLQERRLWTTGRTVPAFGVQGECTNYVNLLLLSYCTLFVTYEKAPGQAVRHEVAGIIYGGLDSELPRPVVKVDPADPDRFALNAMVEQSGARWLALGEIGACGLVISALVALGVWLGLRDLFVWRALARDPQPSAVRLTGSRLVRTPNNAREVSFEYWQGDRLRTVRQRFPVLPARRGTPRSAWRYEAPIRLDADGGQGLALIGARGARLVPTNVRPLVMTEEERSSLLAAAGPPRET